MTALGDFLVSLSGTVGLWRDGAIVILFGIVCACALFYASVWDNE